MKTIGVMAAAAALVLTAGAAQAGDVVVNVKGLRSGGGTLYAGLQTRDQFMKPTGEFGAKLESPAAGDKQLVIKDVAAGEYSLGVLHDANGNKVLDFTQDGRPAEGVAMGPSREPLKGPPTFDQVKIVVPATGTTTIDATMWYASAK